MLICVKCEIEVEQGSSKCPQCGGPVDEVNESDLEFCEDDAPCSPGADAADRVSADAETRNDPPAAAPEDFASHEETPPPAPAWSAPLEPAQPDGAQSGSEPPPQSAGSLDPTADAASAPPGTDLPSPDQAGGQAADAAPQNTAGSQEGGSVPQDGAGEGGEKKKRRTTKIEKPGKKDSTRKSKKDEVKEAGPPKPPVSIYLPQSRLPVKLASLMTLFLSFYLAADFTVAIIFGSLHLLQGAMSLWGIISFLFLWGHGKLGRAGAIILGVLVLLGSVVFMFRFKQENQMMMVAMLFYTLQMFVLTTGKGWFLRTFAGLLLAPFVMVFCLFSLAMDFVPAHVIVGPASNAIKDSKNALSDAVNDPEKIAEAVRPVEIELEKDRKLIEYFEMVPWKKMGPGRFVAWWVMGRKRVMNLYYLPAIMSRFLYENNPESLMKAGEIVALKGNENSALAERGVAAGTLEVRNKAEEGCFRNSDFSLDEGGLFGISQIRRLSSSGRIADPDEVTVNYKYFNVGRYAYLEEASKYNFAVIDMLTGGEPFGQAGEAIAAQYAERNKNGYVINDTGTEAYQLLKNVLGVEVVLLDRKVAEIVDKIKQARLVDPKDQSALDSAASEAAEVKARFEELFILITWMHEKLDNKEDGDLSARRMIGHVEFNMIFVNYTRLLNALHDLSPDPAGVEGKALLEEALKQIFEAMRCVTQRDDPTRDEFRMQIAALQARLSSDFQKERWDAALQLIGTLGDKERLLGEGLGPREDVPKMDWLQGKNSFDMTIYTIIMVGNSLSGAEIEFEVVLIDRYGVLSGREKPFLKGFRLQREGFTGEFYCHAGPAKGLRVVLLECKVLDAEGKTKHEFGRAQQNEYFVNVGEWIAPLLWTGELDNLAPAPEHKKVRIEIQIQEKED